MPLWCSYVIVLSFELYYAPVSCFNFNGNHKFAAICYAIKITQEKKIQESANLMKLTFVGETAKTDLFVHKTQFLSDTCKVYFM